MPGSRRRERDVERDSSGIRATSAPPHELDPAARLVLASLREQSYRATVRMMAAGPLGRVLASNQIRPALLDLRARGLAREVQGRWHLTPLGLELRVEGRCACPCTVTSDREGPRVTVRASGALRDGGGARSLHDALERAHDQEPEIVVLDLSASIAIGEGAMRAIAEADERGRRTGVRVVLVPGPEPVQGALARCDLAQRLTFVPGLATAA